MLVVGGLGVLAVRLAPRTAVPAGWSAGASASELDSFLRRESSDLNLPGLAVVVLRDGAPAYRGFVGTAASGGPVSGDTPFVLGSTSKQFTGLAVQRLVSEGRLTLDTPLAEVLPELGPATVRIRDLLSHTSGISTASGLQQWGWWPARSESIGDNVRELATAVATGSPGSTFEYSNANFDLLGAVVERVEGKRYADAMAELVFSPLGLAHTSAEPPEAGQPDGYYTWFGAVTAPTLSPRTPGAAPSSFLTSTADDLTTLLRAHLGSVKTGLPTAVLASARAPLVRAGDYADYASGWYVRPLWEQHPLDAEALESSLPRCITHEGNAYRSMSFLLACPTTGFGVVALTDVGGGADADAWTQFQEDLIHLTLGTPAPVLSSDLVQAEAPVLMIGAVTVQLVVTLGLFSALRRRRRVALWGVLAVAVTLAVLWLAWFYGPNATGSFTPIPALWANVPDLATTTILASVLTLVVLVAVLAAARRRSSVSR